MHRFDLDKHGHGGAKERMDIAAAKTTFEQGVARIRQGIIGETATMESTLPLSTRTRRILYTDYTASGRALDVVERYLLKDVLPLYANTHTVSSTTARQTTYFRSEARSIIKHYYNCGYNDALIFTGNGATGATAVFVDQLAKTNGFEQSGHFRKETRWGSIECAACGVTFKTDAQFHAHAETEAHKLKAKELQLASKSRSKHTGCCIVIDPMSHHSSILPYRELAKSSPINYELAMPAISNETGLMCLESFTNTLKDATDRKKKIICVLNGTSNVTGCFPDHAALNELVHEYSGIVLWDHAGTAGHRIVDMHPPSSSAGKNASCDFVIASPHKFLGGPGSPGVLIARKDLLTNGVPSTVGGGIVQYVSRKTHSYIDNHEDREEAGTPNIVGSIKAGLAYHVHCTLGVAAIAKLEETMTQKVLSALHSHRNVEVMGPTASTRVGIISFNIVYHQGSTADASASTVLYLHYNFVAALLNDLFGIQVRGGCACAGPYSQWLLGMSEKCVDEYEHLLRTTGLYILRPGFVRTGVHFTMTESDLQVLIHGILWVAEHGWKLLGAYTYHEESGEWEARISNHDSKRRWLSSVGLFDHPANSAIEVSVHRGDTVLSNAAALVAEADALLEVIYLSTHVTLNLVVDTAIPSEYDKFIFFARPTDFLHTLRKNGVSGNTVSNFVGMKPVASDHAAPFQTRLVLSGQVGSAEQPNGAHSSADDCNVDGRAHPGKRPHQLTGNASESAAVEEGISKKPRKKDLKSTIHGVMIPKSLRAAAGEAIREYSMINEGDRILVGLSGGKDSLSLLFILLMLQKVSPVKFRVGAATVNPMTPEYDPSPLIPYMAQLGVEYAVLSQPLIELAKEKMDAKKPSICAFCSRMKRGMLYSHMRKNNYNVLALGQHLDDLVESFVMALFRNGTMTTMKANYTVQEGDIRVIRPLVHCREKAMRDMAVSNNLPLIADNCPACFAAPKERHRIKLLLSQQEHEFPSLFPTVLKAIKPLIAISETDQVRRRGTAFTQESAANEDSLVDAAEEILLPCNSGACPLPQKLTND
ncbi:tRNA 2-thiocytidine biosynthesis protein TtcA [Diplonema papillatum]|nr:tRNA 2-thiocytidine biosynthesis protein TtcA [Diplonema papillatum]